MGEINQRAKRATRSQNKRVNDTVPLFEENPIAIAKMSVETCDYPATRDLTLISDFVYGFLNDWRCSETSDRRLL